MDTQTKQTEEKIDELKKKEKERLQRSMLFMMFPMEFQNDAIDAHLKAMFLTDKLNPDN